MSSHGVGLRYLRGDKGKVRYNGTGYVPTSGLLGRPLGTASPAAGSAAGQE